MTPINTATTPLPSGVVPIDVRRRRERLEYLQDLRWRLAVLAAERASHDLEDAWGVFGEFMSVENTILEEFPEVYSERFPVWVEMDAQLTHEPTVLSPDCGICQAIASHGGINLTPPDAA